ncbi:unnamed protein product [Brassica napus]|uniref:(rape) hypothetical protein n=1 Tax=Brassica napus TaxID=3708 RepID=A0A816YQZ9_BRANA|nr:unnamed protein product [Brassica napus]
MKRPELCRRLYSNCIQSLAHSIPPSDSSMRHLNPSRSSTLIQATINANRLPRFRDRLAAGTMYSVSGFDVARCAQNFKLADSSFLTCYLIRSRQYRQRDSGSVTRPSWLV